MVESYKGLFSGQSIPEDGEERGESARNRVTINLSGTNKGKDTVRTIKTTANRMTVCVCCVCVCVCVFCLPSTNRGIYYHLGEVYHRN